MHKHIFLVLFFAFLSAALMAKTISETTAQPAGNSQTQTAGQNNVHIPSIKCQNPHIIDGDTLTCGRHRVRLAGIDAPEMPGSCKHGRKCVSGDPHKSKAYLHKISRGDVTCKTIEYDRYGRAVAQCHAGGVDFSCAMIES